MAEFLVEQYILHSTPYKETSALVTGLSREQGKVRFVAKGIRSEKNKFKGLTQSFSLLSTKLTGKGELKSGVAMEVLQPAISLTGIHLFCAMYCNEILVRMLAPEEPCPEVFERYQVVLSRLSAQAPPEPLLREFELFLLQEMGAAYDFLYDCISAEEIATGRYYQFYPEQGFALSKTRAGSNTYKGEDLIAISQGDWTAESLQAAKRFCRIALLPWIGKKPLKSRELFLLKP